MKATVKSDYLEDFYEARFFKRLTMKLNVVSAAVLLAGVVLVAPLAVADDTGFASIHTMQKVGGKTCFADHSHGGSGSGATRAAAEAQAIKSWYGYTAGEYGSDWSNINKAVRKSMKCGQSGGSWNCDVDATPCK